MDTPGIQGPDPLSESLPAQSPPSHQSPRSAHHRRVQRSRKRSRSDELIRGFLVGWTALLTLLLLLAYLVTRDIRVLNGGTIIALAVGFVYAYYFRLR